MAQWIDRVTPNVVSAGSIPRSRLKIYINQYTKEFGTMCPPGYHNSGSVATHILGIHGVRWDTGGALCGCCKA